MSTAPDPKYDNHLTHICSLVKCSSVIKCLVIKSSDLRLGFESELMDAWKDNIFYTIVKRLLCRRNTVRSWWTLHLLPQINPMYNFYRLATKYLSTLGTPVDHTVLLMLYNSNIFGKWHCVNKCGILSRPIKVFWSLFLSLMMTTEICKNEMKINLA